VLGAGRGPPAHAALGREPGRGPAGARPDAVSRASRSQPSRARPALTASASTPGAAPRPPRPSTSRSRTVTPLTERHLARSGPPQSSHSRPGSPDATSNNNGETLRRPGHAACDRIG
jgi:hypothetical protein